MYVRCTRVCIKATCCGWTYLIMLPRVSKLSGTWAPASSRAYRQMEKYDVQHKSKYNQYRIVL